MAKLSTGAVFTFTELLNALDATRGNLSTHIKALETHTMLIVRKEFVANKPRTSYIITKSGRENFKAYVTLLTTILESTKGK